MSKSKAKRSILSKLSVKTVFGPISNEDIQNEVEIMIVTGIIKGAKQGESAYGAYTCLLGTFMARKPNDETTFISGKLFMPNIALDLVAPYIADGIETKFALKIGIKKPADDQTVKYQYTVESLIEPDENDALALLETQAFGASNQLEAKADHAPDEDKEPSKAASKRGKK